MDTAKKWREPIAIVVEVVIGISMVWSFFSVARKGLRDGQLFLEMSSTGGRSLGIASLVMLMLVVSCCFFIAPITKHAHALAVAGALILLVAAVFSFIFLLAGLWGSDSPLVLTVFEILGGLTDVFLKAGCAMVLWKMSESISKLQKKRASLPLPQPSVAAQRTSRPLAGGATRPSAGNVRGHQTAKGSASLQAPVRPTRNPERGR